jgi:hypothetical protein
LRADRLIPVASLAVALVGTACAGTTLPVRPGPSLLPAYHPTGTLIMEVGTSLFDRHIVQVSLPDLKTSRFDIPQFNSFFGGAGTVPDGTVYALSTYFVDQSGGPSFQSISQLFAGQPGHGQARAIGTQLNQVSGFQLRGTTGVGYGCLSRFRSIYVIDLSGDRTWRKVAEGCAAALSPDGRQLAWVDHGVLWTMPVSGGSPDRVTDLAALPALAAAGVTRIPDGFDTLEWGPQGLALMVGQGTWFALVALPGGAPFDGAIPIVIPLGTNQPGGMAWQPNGPRLAFGDHVTKSQTAEIRVLDLRTGSLRQVAATDHFGTFQWSPDGRVLAVAREASVTAFVNVDGNQLGTVAVGGGIDAWTR